MVDKVKSLNWVLYFNITLVLSNILTLFGIIHITNHTAELSNQETIVSYLIVGLIMVVLLKLNNAATNRFKDV